MIHSMTGYGRAETIFHGNKIVIEIRSINGKSSDIGIKGTLIPKCKEQDVRLLISSHLHRGTIDIFVHSENGGSMGQLINKERFMAYYTEICSLQKGLPELGDQVGLLSSILRIPEVVECKSHELDEEQWEAVLSGIRTAIEQINLFREHEGARLEKDILERVALIESYLAKIADYEESRLLYIKERILNKLNDLSGTLQPDKNRFEQELIYYIEKLDITEEKVRLQQHCSFFKNSVINEKCQGRKLLFITQEMGREINTMGGKANHAAMQQWVVMMKDELEKIKEQLMNVL